MDVDRSDPSWGEVTVVVVTWEGAHLLPDCLESVRAQTLPHRLLVVDNASTDDTPGVLAGFPDAEILRLGRNAGFAGGVAAALDRVTTPYIALLNNDATAEPGWLAASMDALADPSVGGVTARMLLPDGRVNNAGVVLLPTGYGADRGLGEADGPPYDRPAPVFGVSGGACVLRTGAVRAVGGIDPAYFLYYEDTDLSWRLRLAGWELVYAPDAVVHHRHAASSDVRSASFAFHNERNRLLTLVRCAPLPKAVGWTARFVLTTVSLAVRRMLGSRPPEPVFDPRLRLRVLGSFLRLAPRVLADRRRVTARSTLSRAEVLTSWLSR